MQATQNSAFSVSHKRLLYSASSAFLLLMAIGLFMEFYYVWLLPIVLVVLWAAFYKLPYLLLFVACCTPFSLSLENTGLGGIGIYLPTEPILVGILILFAFKILSGRSIDPVIYRHPLSYLLYIYLTWMMLTSINSELPVVSFKFLLNKMWFIIPMYFIATHVFADFGKIRIFAMCYLFPLFGVIIYTVIRHSQFGFDKDSSHWVMEPLFKDHTSYGAVLAMFLPVLIGLLMKQKMNLLLRVLLAIGLVILVTGLILSYTRAAWLSVIAASALLVFMLLRVKLSTLLIGVAGIGILVAISWEDLGVMLQKNKQESSDKLEEHVSSISNVSSDASNLERLNRWHCAIEMFKERPLAGWGPGTYQFVYAPFQRSSDRTIISTNQGTGGNAHSEYLGPLCEQGLPGMFIMLTLVIMVTGLSFRIFYATHDYDTKVLIASLFLGLFTYFVHGVLNNYLDTDKASVPFWGFIAALVAIDIYGKKQKTINSSIS